ncbi:MAG TPA: 2-C-methyl-D-erythritol 4-phosphate cytidylyltransferase [Ignavibacteria bacterium]|nr:2-C-methyl-D-erythritol 4-phosphate cytidylyltransferase [Ignavibacteria bacterium]
MKTFVIIPAGGKGLRSGSSVPKQYLKFYGKELIAYTIETFQKSGLVDQIIIAAELAYHKRLLQIIKEYKFTKVNSIVDGGTTRQDSVFNCIKSLNAEKNDMVVVHDAARPLLTKTVLNNAIKYAEEKGNAVVSIKAKDTLVKGANTVDSYIKRENVHYIQTPQIFKYKDFIKAIKYSEENNYSGTDESSLMKKIGKRIFLVNGSAINIKITTKEDLKIFKTYIK